MPDSYKRVFIVLVVFLFGAFFLFSFVSAQAAEATKDDGDCGKPCCGIELNTKVPFIGDCIEFSEASKGATGSTINVTPLTAFPLLMAGLTKILMTAIFIFSFLMVIMAGFLMVTGSIKGVEGNYKKGVDLLTKVVVSLILLGMVGLILKIVNPNFFG